MDEISTETLASLVNQTVKLEVNGKILTCTILSVDQETVRVKIIKRGKAPVAGSIAIDEIDAIFVMAKSKPVGY